MDIDKIIGQKQSDTLEFKAVLPPSKSMAQLISSFANTKGGYIILGVSDNSEINGLSEDFHANSITHKALDLLTPMPKVSYEYTSYKGKKLYVVEVAKSTSPIYLEGKIYQRIGATTKLLNPVEIKFNQNGYARINEINQGLERQKADGTSSMIKFLEHCQSILKIIDDLGSLLYPNNPSTPTTNHEGKILARILYSSFVDNFETYLSDLLYEIFLANPATLKSNQTVTIEEVLNCVDLSEFIKYWSKQKLSKLQKGSVKGFIKENKQISDLKVLDEARQNEIERILQIRHLYSHRNGIVDEKFLQYFSSEFILNQEHQMTIDEICDRLYFLVNCTRDIDGAARKSFKLSRGN